MLVETEFPKNGFIGNSALGLRRPGEATESATLQLPIREVVLRPIESRPDTWTGPEAQPRNHFAGNAHGFAAEDLSTSTSPAADCNYVDYSRYGK
jgi:hypothetical protein